MRVLQWEQIVGGIAGALLDRNNPWRGGVIGGVLGAVAGATLTEISTMATRGGLYVWKTC
jgi:hypothetical protein